MIFYFLFFLETLIKLNINGQSAVQKDGTSLSPAELERIVQKVGEDCIQKSVPHEQEDRHNFLLLLMEELQLEIEVVYRTSSLHITVRCTSLEILENMWQYYTSGALNEAAQRHLVTDEVLDLYNLQELKLSTNIDEEEYRRCKVKLTEIEGKQREMGEGGREGGRETGRRGVCCNSKARNNK